MSLGMAAGQFTKGYLGQEDVEMRRSAGEAEAAARSTERAESSEARKLKMEQVKDSIRREYFKDNLQHLMVGDFAAAEADSGKSGKLQIEKG